MNLHEFAERIVFGTTLDQKLTPPGKLAHDADEQAGSPKLSRRLRDRLDAPSRPLGLEMHNGPGLSQPPADNELENDKARGRLLHFLANHELLATELMALVLLKFPDAPQQFRLGILETLQEEQAHTRMYLQRMRECGVQLGEYPLSGHFWRIVEPMRDPIDFVSRLSLTFEQANLDYAVHYARLFEQLSDRKTAAILQKVYRDEISHVQHGLHWFRKWKDPGKSDWDAYRSQLQFPMSPQRARGPKCDFNREGRLQAGLDLQFVDSIEVYRQSRGRPPVVRWFDPAIESSLADTKDTESRASQPKQARLMSQLQQDLGLLMIWLSKEDDVVLTPQVPTHDFRKRLLASAATLPEFVAWDQRDSLSVRKLSELKPWAWVPKTADDSLALHSSAASVPQWESSQRHLFGKSWAAERLTQWLKDSPNEKFANAEATGHSISDADQLPAIRSQYSSLGYERLLFKTDFATSGRGQRSIPSAGNLDPQDQRWIQNQLQRQTGVVEPELDRVADISFLFDAQDDELKFLGWTRQRVTANRRYAGTFLRRPFADCSTDIKQFLLADDCRALHETKAWLTENLQPELAEREFRGLCGVDVLLCRTPDGNRLKPLVEFNPRCTMGHIALALQERIASNTRAEFRILRIDEYTRLCEQNTNNNPDATPICPGNGSLKLTLTRDGAWKSGLIILSEPTATSLLVPLVAVGNDARTAVQIATTGNALNAANKPF